MHRSTLFAVFGLSICLAVVQSWGITLSDVDHAVCFDNIMSHDAGETRVKLMSFEQLTKAYLSNGGFIIAVMALLPYLVCSTALGLVKSPVFRALVLFGIVVLALLSMINGLTSPDMQHDCDRKGSQSGFMMGLSYSIALFILFFGTIVGALERIAIAENAEEEKP